MTSQVTPAPPAVRTRAARLPMPIICWASFAMCVALLVQYGLGIAVNLFVTLPRQDHEAGPGSAIARAMSHGPLAVAIHAGLGLALIVMALAMIIRAVITRQGGIIALALAGLLALGSAAYNGARFVGTGQNDASFTMALDWAIALLAYLLILFIASRARPDPRQDKGPKRSS
jgi:hypothetical protein